MNIFLDLGAHLLESVECFHRMVDDPSSWSVFSFEAAYDYEMKVRLDHLMAHSSYLDDFASFTFFPGAINITHKPSTFYRDLSHPLPESSTLISSKPFSALSKNIVPSFNLISFLSVFAPHCNQLVMKSDIEGFEYQLFDSLFSNNLLHFFDCIYIELHEFKLGKDINLDYRLFFQLYSSSVKVFSWDATSFLSSKFASADHLQIIDLNYIHSLYLCRGVSVPSGILLTPTPPPV